MNNNEKKFIKKLFSGSIQNSPGKCPSAEDLSDLIDGVVEEAEKDDLMKHISKCSRCYEIYRTAKDLAGEKNIKKQRIFNPFSIAASIFIAVISMIVFYKINVREDIDLKKSIDFSAEVSVSSPHIEDKVAPIEKFKDKGTGKLKPGKGITPPLAPSPEPKRFKEVKITAPEKRSEISGKIAEEGIGKGKGGVISEKVDKKNKTDSESVLRSEKFGKEISENKIAMRSVLSKNEVREYSSQGRSRDSKILPGSSYTLNKKRAPEFRRKKGSRGPECYNRERDFLRVTEKNKSYPLPLSDIPEIKKIVHLSDLDNYSGTTAGENILVEFKINQEGIVVQICVLKGGAGRVKFILNTLSGWTFSPVEPEFLRFRMELLLDKKGKFKILN
ncbi:MAG: zf-HC2 domain-containing protein [Acidobacteriota bacterium]